MVSAGFFDDLSDADIDSLIDDAIPKDTKKATVWGIFVFKGKVANFEFFLLASLGASCQQFCQLQHFVWFSHRQPKRSPWHFHAKIIED